MKNDNERAKKRRALLLTKTTVSNLNNFEMNRVVGGYSVHTEQCNDWSKDQTSGLPSCPNFPG